MKLFIFTGGGFHTVKTFCRYLINMARKFANMINKAVVMKIFALGRIIMGGEGGAGETGFRGCSRIHALKSFCINIALKFANVINKAVIMKNFTLDRIITGWESHALKNFCINIYLKFANVINKAVIMKYFALGRIITCQGFHALKNFCRYNKSIIYK